MAAPVEKAALIHMGLIDVQISLARKDFCIMEKGN